MTTPSITTLLAAIEARAEAAEVIVPADMSGDELYNRNGDYCDASFAKKEVPRLAAVVRALLKAVEGIAAKSSCDCYEHVGMGSGITPKWIGCAAHNSDDPEEWCMTCAAHSALAEAERLLGGEEGK